MNWLEYLNVSIMGNTCITMIGTQQECSGYDGDHGIGKNITNLFEPNSQLRRGRPRARGVGRPAKSYDILASPNL